MLQFILMFLGLVIPNSNSSTHSTNVLQTEMSQTQNNDDHNSDITVDGDHSGGETPSPPKK